MLVPHLISALLGKSPGVVMVSTGRILTRISARKDCSGERLRRYTMLGKPSDYAEFAAAMLLAERIMCEDRVILCVWAN